jgi:hypothetical protein
MQDQTPQAPALEALREDVAALLARHDAELIRDIILAADARIAERIAYQNCPVGPVWR